MVEFLDNLTQLLAALSGCVLAGVFYLRSRRQPYFLLCCFLRLLWVWLALLAAVHPACHGRAAHVLRVGHRVD